MKKYILMAMINTGRDIVCEKCGALENLELHHTKYAPLEEVSIFDLKILCGKCHRGSSRKDHSHVRTVYENGIRYCEVNRFRFQY